MGQRNPTLPSQRNDGARVSAGKTRAAQIDDDRHTSAGAARPNSVGEQRFGDTHLIIQWKTSELVMFLCRL